MIFFLINEDFLLINRKYFWLLKVNCLCLPIPDEFIKMDFIVTRYR
jgi:hypothetical protein